MLSGGPFVPTPSNAALPIVGVTVGKDPAGLRFSILKHSEVFEVEQLSVLPHLYSQDDIKVSAQTYLAQDYIPNGWPTLMPTRMKLQYQLSGTLSQLRAS